MSRNSIHTLLAAAAIGISAGAGPSINSAYTQQRDRQHDEQAKALAKKQRVREEIRARKASKSQP